MKITLNGRKLETAPGICVSSLLADLKIEFSRAAVAVNSRVIPRSRISETTLQDGDNVEVIEAVGGG